MGIDVEIEGIPELEATWARVVTEIRVGVTRGVGLGARDGAAEARTKHSFKNRTGDLERSIQHVVVGWVGEWYFAKIVAAAPHASFVEYDTKPHLIAGSPFLTFEWQGELVHFRYVNHPGTTGQPFMHLAYYKCERVMAREIEAGIARAQAILAR